MEKSEFLEMLKGRVCTVIGLGISNLPLIDFLLEHGARITARDKKTRRELGRKITALEKRGVRLILGEGYLSDIDEDIIFRTPGLRPDTPELAAAVARGAILTSEMELFLELTPARVLAVTGSDGKTTTTTLVGRIMETSCRRRCEGRVFVGGNIGTPLLPRVFEMTDLDFAVVELSSFQLQNASVITTGAVLTNVTPNHLNWHTDMEEYTAAKTNVYRHNPYCHLVANAENEITRRLAEAHPGPVTLFSSQKHSWEEFEITSPHTNAIYVKENYIAVSDGTHEQPIMYTDDIRLPGIHNLENVMAAFALTMRYASFPSMRIATASFRGVPHRLELVRRLQGVSYYNSSIDSTPTRTAAAISALKTPPIVICGGYDKNVPFEPLAEALCTGARAAILTGATAGKIRAALEAREEVRTGTFPVYEAPDLAAAVTLAASVAREGDVVLLSPACASFDAFKNFEARGRAFRRAVRALRATPSQKKG